MISSLHLHNFKCFGDQDFPLKALTLLTGLNSTGKSSVLQSLLLLRHVVYTAFAVMIYHYLFRYYVV